MLEGRSGLITKYISLVALFIAFVMATWLIFWNLGKKMGHRLILKRRSSLIIKYTSLVVLVLALGLATWLIFRSYSLLLGWQHG